MRSFVLGLVILVSVANASLSIEKALRPRFPSRISERACSSIVGNITCVDVDASCDEKVLCALGSTCRNGKCVISKPGDACTDDDQCNAIIDSQSCFNKMCVDDSNGPLTEGQSCGGSSPCAKGLWCSSGVTTYVKASTGTCKTMLDTGATCTVEIEPSSDDDDYSWDAGCKVGWCLKGKCAQPVKADVLSGADGASCYENGQCGRDLYCNLADRVCRPIPSKQLDCSTAADCGVNNPCECSIFTGTNICQASSTGAQQAQCFDDSMAYFDCALAAFEKGKTNDDISTECTSELETMACCLFQNSEFKDIPSACLSLVCDGSSAGSLVAVASPLFLMGMGLFALLN